MQNDVDALFEAIGDVGKKMTPAFIESLTLGDVQRLDNILRTLADHAACQVRILRYPQFQGQRGGPA
jgi:hypothetical protein